MTVGGFLARCGLPTPQIKYFVEAIARTAGDPEPQDRRKAAEDHSLEFHAGRPARGYPQLVEAFGEKVAKKVAEWLNYKGPTGDAEERHARATYFSDADGIWKKTGDAPVRLANFTADIVEDVAVDDGSGEIKRKFVIKHAIKGREGTVQIAAEQFDNLSWVTREMGSDATITPGQYVRAHLANAIKTLNADERIRGVVYAHVGWRKIDGRLLYLHAAGAIGVDGPVEGIRVELEGELAQFTLPTVDPNPQAALRTSLRMLDMAPKQKTWLLLAATFLAPLGEFVPLTTSVFFTGGTGTRKTAMQAIGQGHWYWEETGKRLPANWSSTANALEATAFRAKDALLVVDDFCPRGAPIDVARYHHAAERLFRAQGNRAGRGRMFADGRLRAQMHPRGLLAASGEDTPSGHSLRARTMICEISADDVDLRVLTELQKAAGDGVLKQTMAGYVRFIAGQDTSGSVARLATLRTEATKSVGGGHTRTPENVALLMLGVENLLAYAESVGADADAKKLRSEAWEALLAAGKEQDRHQKDEQPHERFKALLGDLLSSGRAHIKDSVDGRKPSLYARELGWVEKHKVDDDGFDTVVWHPCGHAIGWLKT